MANKAQPEKRRALFLGGHVALDFLNTVMRVNGALVDFFEHDDDVVSWLGQAGFPIAKIGADTPPLSFLRAARTLRESLRSLIEKRKAGKQGDLSVLNAFLAEALSYPKLVFGKSRSLKIERVRRLDTPEQILSPVAEAAADLLTTVDLDVVKRCEDGTCILWFYDQTKSHHRRWCSMAICGNRHKVATYRKRRLDEGV